MYCLHLYFGGFSIGEEMILVVCSRQESAGAAHSQGHFDTKFDLLPAAPSLLYLPFSVKFSHSISAPSNPAPESFLFYEIFSISHFAFSQVSTLLQLV